MGKERPGGLKERQRRRKRGKKEKEELTETERRQGTSENNQEL